ncbi:MAG: deoxyguanosinetriphosphate triphosphohydrolase [candidate division Zixibacteria bacterium]|nr:deoxyguanosinetriphosphate triphosphohydrolase [candidate division Zixibacteria bacterium]
MVRSSLEQRERQSLAGYAAQSTHSLGRVHREEQHPYRTEFQRDRERIIHSAAFRRLEYKTQVFVNHEGDNYRTRLTHSIEVAQIARSIARALALNEDLAEAVALAHDLGHTPFGHAGEDALNKKMEPDGGFSHNRQSLRVVDVLEERYPSFVGLNLTFEVREGIVKHETIYDKAAADTEGFHPEWKPTLEAQLVNLADEIAYNSHDLDDGLRAGLFGWDDLAGLPLWQELNDQSRREHPDLDGRLRRHHVVRLLINRQVTDLVDHASRLLTEKSVRTLDDVRQADSLFMRFSPEFATKISAFKNFLFHSMYRHYRLVRMALKAERIVHGLFDAYTQEPRQLDPKFLARLQRPGLEPSPTQTRQVVCDYIAGMTDRYAMLEYRKLFDPLERV